MNGLFDGGTSSAALQVEALRHTVGDRRLLDGATLVAHPGETVGLVGTNGSGKTTLLRCVYGALRPDGGRVLLDGADTTSLGAKPRARRIAAVPQENGASFGLTAREVAAMGRSPHKRFWEPDDAGDSALVEAALERTGADHLASLPFDALSGGEKQRTLLARALTQQPALLVLDEPTNHLDVRHQLDLLTLLTGLATTCLLALHDLNLAAYFCDRLYVLDGGRMVAEGPPSEVLTEELLAEVYGVRAEVGRHPATGAPTVVYLPGGEARGGS